MEPHRPAQVWADIMSKLDNSTLRKNFDPWHGLGTSPVELINRLLKLIDALKLPVTLPNKVWENNLQELLNRLHVHFPAMEKTETDPQIKEWLTEYNDIIHTLEDIERNDGFIWLNILPDSEYEYDLLDSDYNLFTASKKFGDLCLHYPHVGRHLLEILKSKDYDCPADQIIPQHTIRAYHSLRFYEDTYSEEEHQSFLQNFLDTNALGKTYRFGDPKIAFGYINMGKLRYSDKTEVIEIVKNTRFIKYWKIIT